MTARNKNWKRISAFVIGVLALLSMLFICNNLAQTETGGFFTNALIYLFGYFIFGILFGAIWQDKHWHWTVWLIIPMLILTGISMLFAGIYLSNFLISDLPIIFTAFFAAVVGNFVGAEYFFYSRFFAFICGQISW